MLHSFRLLPPPGGGARLSQPLTGVHDKEYTRVRAKSGSRFGSIGLGVGWRRPAREAVDMVSPYGVAAEHTRVYVPWTNAVLSCDGGVVSVSPATELSTGETALGALPGLPQRGPASWAAVPAVWFSWPPLDAETGDPWSPSTRQFRTHESGGPS